MIPNLVADRWLQPDRGTLPVYNPATAEVIGEVPQSGPEEVEAAVGAAARAFDGWARTPVLERVRLMFRFRELVDQNIEELARLVTLHHGKTLDEARGEIRRGIEVIEFACGAPTLLQGRTLREVSHGIDQDLYRYPIGVVAGITPFNFPVMIPLWMLPLAVVTGNTFILKPSEMTPLGARRLAELFLEAGFPPGVLNVVHGGREAVDSLIAHPGVHAVSFVGSERVARHVYEEAARAGKRVQAAGGAKNHIIVMPDANLDVAVPAVLNSAFGNAGERCLAGSIAVTVGKMESTFLERLRVEATQLKVGPGDQEGVQVGPLIREQHRKRVLSYVEQGLREGARLLVDGRRHVERDGFFLGPIVLTGVQSEMMVAREEIFGPVLAVSHVATLEEAVRQASGTPYGNMATIFTSSGRAAREFRDRVEAGMVGINVGVAQPLAFYPFSGWKGSFYGDLHVHGMDGVEFYTRKKVVVLRW
jgi:malonate-semialdehyde dehydrogenase (acetylating) / methylmalonate-semialdehyde dehydrogenase